jgi:hypothetical protein
VKPSSKKQKGSRLEREFAELLRGYGIDKQAKRMPLSGAFDDSRMKADIITDLPIHFECKNQENWSPLEYWKQANETCGARVPVVVMSRNRENIYVFLLASDFLTIIKSALVGGYTGSQPISISPRPKKTSQDDVEWQGQFSKFAMAHRKEKT